MVFVGVATYIIPKEVFFTIMNASAFSFPQVKLVVILDKQKHPTEKSVGLTLYKIDYLFAIAACGAINLGWRNSTF